MQPGYDQWTGSDVAQDFRPLVRLRRTRGDMAMVFEMWVMLSLPRGEVERPLAQPSPFVRGGA